MEKWRRIPRRKSSSLRAVRIFAAVCVSTFPSDRKSTRLNSSHLGISYAVFCLKKKKINKNDSIQVWHELYETLLSDVVAYACDVVQSSDLFVVVVCVKHKQNDTAVSNRTLLEV